MQKRAVISIAMDGQVYEADLSAETGVPFDSFATLNVALAEHPAKAAWWGVLRVRAQSRVADLKAAQETLHAELYGKQTEGTVDARKGAVLLDKRYQDASAAVRAAQEDLGMLEVARDALRDRKDVLLEVARNLRAEADNEMMVAKRDGPQVLRTPAARRK